MNMKWMIGALCLLTGCGATGGEDREERASEIQLNLSTIGASGTEYRLGPATFDIFDMLQGDQTPINTLMADGTERTLHVPLAKGYYTVNLRPGWGLSRLDGQALTPIAATLTSPEQQRVNVAEYETALVNYAFHLGESGIDIGLTVDEGIPPGYDARLVRTQPEPSPYTLEWRGGGSICCFANLADAQANYGNANIYLAPN